MTKPDKNPAVRAKQKTPSASKRDTKISDHFQASGNKKGENLTQDPTKTTKNIPPVPVTNNKAKDPEEKGSPIPSKDLQDQFNNDPLETDPNNNPPEKTPAETPTPTDAPATPSYAAALTGHTTPTPEEDFLTQGGFTIHKMDKRKRSTSATNSPSPSLRSPDAKQSKFFQKGHSPHRHPATKKQAPPTPKKPDTKSPAVPSPPTPKAPTEEHMVANHPDKGVVEEAETGHNPSLSKACWRTTQNMCASP